MPDPTEEPLHLELAASQLHLASARLHLNTLQMQHLALADTVQSTLRLLTQTGMLEPFPLHQKMVEALAELAALQIEQIRRECAVPDLAVVDPYDLRALPLPIDMSGNGEMGWKQEE